MERPQSQLHQAKESIKMIVNHRLRESSLTTFVPSHSNSILNPTSTPNSVTLEVAHSLSIKPKINDRCMLLAALHELADQSDYQNQQNLEIQAAGILNATYCKLLAEKLAV